MVNKRYYLIGFFLILFMVVIGVSYPITGKVVSVVNVTIMSLSSLNFTINSVDFGSGSVYLNSSSASIDTIGNVIGGNWTPVSQGFIVENMGNTNLSVFLKSEKNAAEFLGGTNPGYYYMINNFEMNSCTQTSIMMGSWISVNKVGYGDNICNNIQYADLNDSIRVDLRLVVPSDAIRGSRSDVLTITGINI